MAVTLIVMVGAMFGAVWYLVNNQSTSTIIPSKNKTEYKQGETIKFRVNDTVQICTSSSLPFFIIKSSGEYVKLEHSCMGIIGSGFDQYCENGKIRTERVRGCSDAFSCWDESIHKTFTWDQKEYVEITEECESKIIRREIKKQVPGGKYQIIVNGKIIKEFTIKEK